MSTNCETNVLIPPSNEWILNSSELKNYGLDHFLPIIVHQIVSLVKDIFIMLKLIYWQIRYKYRYENPDHFFTSGKDGDSKALVVLLHGLNSSPAYLHSQRKSIENVHGDQVAYYQPLVPHRGHCSLDQAVSKIQKVIADWSKKNPNKPIIFSGHSNGARMSGYIAASLRTDNLIMNPMTVHAVAGPFFGTRSMNHPSWPDWARKVWMYFVKIFYSDEIINEMSWGSPKSIKIIEKMRKANNIKLHFYAGIGDITVRSYRTSLPKGFADAEYHVYSATGHASIITKAEDEILQNLSHVSL